MAWNSVSMNALVLAAAVVLVASLALSRLRRRRPRALHPLNAGARQLVTHVGALSDLDRGLPIPAPHARRRLGSPAAVH